MADQTITAGGAILTRLKAVDVDYIVANSGTGRRPGQAALRDAIVGEQPVCDRVDQVGVSASRQAGREW